MRLEIAPLITAFVGLVFLIIGVAFGGAEISKRSSCSAQTVAVVSDIVAQSDDDGDAYAPVLKFRDADGNVCEQTRSIYTNPCKYEVGDEVEIAFNPENPAKFYIIGSCAELIFAVIFSGVGLVVFLIGAVPLVAFLILYAKERKKQ